MPNIKNDLTFWSFLISIAGLTITILFSIFGSDHETILFISISTTVLFFFIYFSLYIAETFKDKVEFEKNKANKIIHHKYIDDFETLSSDIFIDIYNSRQSTYKQTREVICKRNGASEYLYRHDHASRLSEFSHNVGKKITEQYSAGDLAFIVQLDRPCRLNEKKILVQTIRMENMYPDNTEFSRYTKRYRGSEFGSYTIVFPPRKGPRNYKSEIIRYQDNLNPVATHNILSVETMKDRRVQLLLIIEPYELKLGDMLSITWDW